MTRQCNTLQLQLYPFCIFYHFKKINVHVSIGKIEGKQIGGVITKGTFGEHFRDGSYFFFCFPFTLVDRQTEAKHANGFRSCWNAPNGINWLKARANHTCSNSHNHADIRRGGSCSMTLSKTHTRLVCKTNQNPLSVCIWFSLIPAVLKRLLLTSW